MTDARKLKRILASMPDHYDGSKKVTLLSENQEYWWFSRPERLAKLRALKLITVFAEPIEWDSHSYVGEQRDRLLGSRGQVRGIRYALRPRYYIPEFPAKVFRIITRSLTVYGFSETSYAPGSNANKTNGQLLEDRFLEYMLPWLEDKSQEENILAMVELSVEGPPLTAMSFARTDVKGSFDYLKVSYDAHRQADMFIKVSDKTIRFVNKPDFSFATHYIAKNRASGPKNT